MLADRLSQAAARAPKKTALLCGVSAWSYRELDRTVHAVAAGLRAMGVRPGDRIGVAGRNTAEFAAFYFVAARLGAAIAPVDPGLPAKTMAALFARAGARHVAGDAGVLRALYAEVGGDGIDGAWLRFDTRSERVGGPGTSFQALAERSAEGAPGRSMNQDEPIASDAPFIITMTSGSTGDPKPIVLSQATKAARAAAAAELYDVTANDVVLAATPLYHSLAMRLVILPCTLGATATVMDRYSVDGWFTHVREHEVSFTIMAASQLSQIAARLSSEGARPPSLRCVVSSSAAIDEATKRVLAARLPGVRLHECYGASEVAIVSDLHVGERPDKAASVGRPAPGVKVRILSDAGETLPVGTRGEIAAKTAQAFSGYEGRPEVTEAAHMDGFFRTGDVGSLDEDGFLHFHGRTKDVIITGGVNVYPADVEAAVMDAPGVLEVAAFPTPDDLLGEAVALAVVEREGERVSTRTLQVLCAERLSDAQQPRAIVVLDALPKNAMGKILRAHLAAMVEETTGKERLNA